MDTKKIANEPSQEEVNEYLNAVRESGSINMFGAAPYVAETFRVPLSRARKYLTTWMETFKG